MVAVLEKDLEVLADADLERLIQYLMFKEEVKREDMLAQLLEQVILLEGKKGRGKTLSATGFSYQMRERFNRQVIVVATKTGLKEPFGLYQYMSMKMFRDELEKVNLAADVAENADAVVAAFEKYGINIINATLVFDESQKLLNCRKSQDKVNQLIIDFLDQIRHYHCTAILCAPNRNRIDKNALQQVDWFGRCYHNKYTDVCTVRLVQGLDVLTMYVDGADDSEHPAYYDMFDSWVMVGYRSSSLKINNI